MTFKGLALHSLRKLYFNYSKPLRAYIRKLYPVLQHPHLITVRISKSALLKNFDAWYKLVQYAPDKPDVAPVLKSNAYGHGLAQIATILAEHRADKIPFIVVDSHFEARTVRSITPNLPILIAGYTEPSVIHANTIPDCAYMVSSMSQLRELMMYCIGERGIPTPVFVPTLLKVHIKIDTGMNRQGIKIDEMNDLETLIPKFFHANMILEGIASHFGSSDSINETQTLAQIELWNTLSEKLTALAPTIKYRHISNTSGILFSRRIRANVLRLGGGLYGLKLGAQIEDSVHLKPVASVYTKLYCIKNVQQGEYIGYGLSYCASRNMTIGLIPLGYNECLPRGLSNDGFVRIGKYFAPIIGRISMNITAIDLTDINDIMILNEGHEVCVISDDYSHPNSINIMADALDTISYDIAVHISPLLRREIVE